MRPHNVILTALFAAGPAWGAELPTTEKPVGRLALPVIPESLVVSPDSSRVAFAAKAGDPTLAEKGVFINPTLTDPTDDSARAVVNPICLYIDDKPTIPFDGMSRAIFSPYSKRLGFAGRTGKTWRLVLDGKTVAQDADDAPANPIVFSPDSAHVAWVVQKDSQFLVAVDGRQWPPIEAGAMGTMAFSPDSRHLAAVVHVRAAWMIYLDGLALAEPAGQNLPAATRPGGMPRLERFGQWTWRPDSKGLGFYAAFAGSTWQVFSQKLDGTVEFASVPCDGVMKDSPVFSPDGKALAFGVTSKGKWAVAQNSSGSATVPTTAAASPPMAFDQLLAESLTYYVPATPESQPALLYLAQQNKKWRLYVNDKPTDDLFDAISLGSFILSPDKHHFAFAGIENGQTVVIRDGAVLARHEEVGGATLAFSPDSQHLAYAARNGGSWCACVDGIGGTAFTVLAGIPPAFSPDSSRIAFAALDGQKTWRLVVGKDGDLRSKAYDAFLKGTHITWRPDGTVVTVAIQKKVAMRVEAKP